MMSSAATSSPLSASTLAYLIRWPVLRLIWLKETFSVSDVAGYRATGQVTSERRKKPFQLARGAMGNSEDATDDLQGYHRGAGFQTRRGGESANGVNRIGRHVPPVRLRPFGQAFRRCPEGPEHDLPSGVALTGGVAALAGFTGTYDTHFEMRSPWQ